jgi:hypothetical protein
MRAIAVLLVALLYPVAPANAQTLGELKAGCERLEAYWQQYPPVSTTVNIPDDSGGASCWGYLGAFFQMANMVSGTGEHDCSKGWGPGCWSALHVCFPKGVTPEQMLAVFLADARNHPAEWHEQANIRYWEAMKAAFPCKGEFSPQNPK